MKLAQDLDEESEKSEFLLQESVSLWEAERGENVGQLEDPKNTAPTHRGHYWV